MPRIDLAFTLMDYFIKYPLPPKEAALLPYNYCALSKALPWMSSILDFIC